MGSTLLIPVRYISSTARFSRLSAPARCRAPVRWSKQTLAGKVSEYTTYTYNINYRILSLRLTRIGNQFLQG